MSKTIPNPDLNGTSQRSFCILVETLFGGMTPFWRDEAGKWVVFKIEAEAMAELEDL